MRERRGRFYASLIAVCVLFYLMFTMMTTCIDRCSRNEARWQYQLEHH